MRKTRYSKIQSERINFILKWILYALLIIISYVYMTSSIGHLNKPLFLIPIALCIAMRESEMTASIVGLICGLMLDSACGKVFGFNAFLLLILCMFTSLMFLYLLRQNIINIVLITIGATLIQGSLDFFFYYAIWGYENVGVIFWRSIFPSMIFTIISSGFIYLIIRFIASKFSVQEEHFIEEKSENIVRE